MSQNDKPENHPEESKAPEGVIREDRVQRQILQREKEELEKSGQIPGGAYNVDPDYAAAASEADDGSFGGNLEEQKDQPTKSP